MTLQTAGSSRREIAGGGRHVPTNMVGRIHLQRILSSWGKKLLLQIKQRRRRAPAPLSSQRTQGGDNYTLLQLEWILSQHTMKTGREREGSAGVGGGGGGGGGKVCYFPNTTRSKVPAGDKK